MNQEKRYQANPVVSCGDEADGAVLFNPDTDDSSIVNLTGRTLWDFLQKPRTRAEVANHLMRTFRDVSLETATRDTGRFLETLVPDFVLELDAED